MKIFQYFFRIVVPAALRGKMERSGTSLGELCGGLIGWGVKTGLNEAFVIDQATKDQLVGDSPSALEIIKPLLEGDNVRKFEVHYRNKYLIYTYHGVDIGRFPSVEKYLLPFRDKLEKRATKQKWFELQQPQMAYRDYFNNPKIIYPDIGKELRFALDENGYFCANTTYFLPLEDWYVCAVLNSSTALQWIEKSLNDIRGGYLRFFGQHMENLPIPNVSGEERKIIVSLARESQSLHLKRRAYVERFLKDIGVDIAQSNSRNPLEQPWTLESDDFAKRTKKLAGRSGDPKLYIKARDETSALTEQITKLEAEIDDRVAALYGLDVEDRKWAAQTAPAFPDEKQMFFFNVLGGLKERSTYFSYTAIQGAVNDAELAIKNSSLRVYLSEATKLGMIHNAGRGWYSRLSESLRLDPKPIQPVIKLVSKKFPLLDFHVWSTGQLNPWMHHLIGKPVIFVNVDVEALEPVWECLRDAGYDALLNPRGAAKRQFSVREKTVVVRRRVNGAPDEDHVARPETVLVDLKLESEHLGLMDTNEFRQMAIAAISSARIEVSALSEYAENRKQTLKEIFGFEPINQPHLFNKGGDS